jgi:hypothetical protein
VLLVFGDDDLAGLVLGIVCGVVWKEFARQTDRPMCELADGANT